MVGPTTAPVAAHDGHQPSRPFRGHAYVIATLFLATMFAGMVDEYFVKPELESSTFDVLASDGTLLVGAFSVMFMAVGIVFIALAFYPVVRIRNEFTALTYVVFRAIECVLLLVGPLGYLYLAGLDSGSPNASGAAELAASIERVTELKDGGYQLGMIVLGLGSLFLCRALYTSELVPKVVAAWGGVGYAFLFLSGVLDLAGVIDTGGTAAILYVPGGLWEIVVLPYWLYRHGFNVSVADRRTSDSTPQHLSFVE